MIPITAYFRCAGDDSMLSQDWQRPGQPAERDPANASEGPVLRARRELPKRPARGSSARHWANASPCQFWIDIEGNESARGSMRRANRRTQATAWARATSGRRGRRGLRTDERALRKAQRRRLPLRCHTRPYSPPGILSADERCGRHEGPCDVASGRFSRRETNMKSGVASAAAPFRKRRLLDPSFASKADPAIADGTPPRRDPKRSCFGNESAEIFRYCTARRAKTTQSAWKSLFPLRFGTLFRESPHLFTATSTRTLRSQRHGTISSEISRFFTVSRKKGSTKASNAMKERRRNGKAD